MGYERKTKNLTLRIPEGVSKKMKLFFEDNAGEGVSIQAMYKNLLFKAFKELEDGDTTIDQVLRFQEKTQVNNLMKFVKEALKGKGPEEANIKDIFEFSPTLKNIGRILDDNLETFRANGIPDGSFFISIKGDNVTIAVNSPMVAK